MICKHLVIATMLTGGLLALSGAAGAQRQQAQSAPDQTLPLCREAEAGERCRTRNGTILIQREARPAAGRDTGQTQNLGGGDPGWEIGDPRPGAGRDEGQNNNLGGGDPGWEVRDQAGIKSPGVTPDGDPEQ
ncbi:hypothetical protein [Maricaulis salignorans]|uniref:Uncharacterized protein n=1 Tax=Maricaulis salignorans TaxID=144026 RepID=A0A1G9P2R7_9PROT|nr:hypothetical protein [Maricaulis salignorans]SDL92465.1 hypothetical protein SAMN04488568_10369 [Maricaulis salignorans]